MLCVFHVVLCIIGSFNQSSIIPPIFVNFALTMDHFIQISHIYVFMLFFPFPIGPSSPICSHKDSLLA